MEQIGAIYEGEWNSYGMCFEEADFMAQLLGNCSIPSDIPNGSHFQVSPAFWADGIDERAIYSSDRDTYNTSMYSFSQGSSYTGVSFFPFPSRESFSHQVFVNDNNVMDHGEDFLIQDVSTGSMESDDVLQEKNSLQLNIPSGSKKRSRIPGEVEKNKRSVKNRKCKKIEDSNGEDNNNNNRRSLSNCCSEDESNVKTRANRGSATDPQSLYARKRRERINERLRMLQKLVPNGTKVDISTMLEEAVQYVKFLQLQIKLLSSDDLWMYAPIAYNGMDLGSLNLKANIPKPES